MVDFIPLISPKAFAEFSPEEYHQYVRSLYKEPPKPEPLPETAVRLNAKNNPVITVRRDPKYLLPTEVDKLASEIGWSRQSFWLEIAKRKIPVRLPFRGKNDGRALTAVKGRAAKGKSKAVKS